MFRRLYVANRGEIARRIAKSARALGMEVAVGYSSADKDALFVTEADHAVELGAPPPKDSYANTERVVAAAKKLGCDALHPGYGFLSENQALVAACHDAGIVFVGPRRDAMAVMGNKASAKGVAREAGVPCVPGSQGVLRDVEHAVEVATTIGYPVMLKASHGGGGIGMVLCNKEKKLRQSFEDAQKKGALFFGCSEVLLENYIASPRHIEVQILADEHGRVCHLHERECSIQRRHQKLLEEAPATRLGASTRAALHEAAIKIARAVGYTNAGTVEFVVDSNEKFYFLEMNTRLQVEHGVTEAICGLDIVAEQLRIAAGLPISLSEDGAPCQGHAIEVRLCAEDPERRFFPSPGTIEHLVWPSGEGIRVDAGVASAAPILPYYDSLFAKIIAHGSARPAAIAKLRGALDRCEITGIHTNLQLHRRILADEAFLQGRYDCNFISENMGLAS